jgi:hypothetical protein
MTVISTLISAINKIYFNVQDVPCIREIALRNEKMIQLAGMK